MPFIDQSQYEFCFLTKSEEALKETPEYQRYHFPIYKFKNVQREGREAFAKEIKSILGDGFDAVHLHTSAWRGFLIEEVAMEMGIGKVIVHSHSSGVDSVNEDERATILREHAYYKERFTLDYATDLCACSWLAADWLFSDRIPRDRIRIMPNAVDINIFLFNRSRRDRIRSELGIENKIVLGNVGRYSYTKNQEFLVRSFAKAYANNPRLFLIMIGQGDNIRNVQELVKNLNLEESILCYGWKNNIPDYLQAMDVFCLPSKFEGLPISAVEAQAAGLKCLVSDQVTRETDIIGDMKFLPLKEDIWAEAILQVTNDYARENVQGKFDQVGYSMEASCKKLIDLYEA